MDENSFEFLLPLEYGLMVRYDGEENDVFYDGIKKYHVGEMMCELARVHPSEIKPMIMGYEGFNKAIDIDNFGDAFNYLETQILEKYGPVAARIIISEFLQLGEEYYKNRDNPEYVAGLNEIDESYSKIDEFILEDTGFSEFGYENIGHMLLTIYSQEVFSFVGFKYLFIDTMEVCTGKEEGDDVSIKIMDLFGSLVGTQHIDFKLMCLEGDFASVYTIKTCMLLLAFEFVHCYQRNVLFCKCKNCGNYFVLAGRSDAVYCSYPDEKHGNKICKDIGAKITRANKEKNDISTKEYRRVYMRLSMYVKRHPADSFARKKLELLTDEVKKWRVDLANGATTVEDYLEWLKEF